MAGELMDQCFRQHCATLGEAILRAKRRMVQEAPPGDTRRATLDSLASLVSPSPEQLTAERAEQVLLFNLLGDPLLRLRYPQSVELAVSEGAAGEPLSVAGVFAGRWAVYGRVDGAAGTLTFTPPRRAEYPRDDQSLQQFQEVYRRANDCRLTVAETVVQRGRFRAVLNVPELARGRCFVRVFVSGQTDCAAGVTAVEIGGKADGGRGKAE